MSLTMSVADLSAPQSITSSIQQASNLFQSHATVPQMPQAMPPAPAPFSPSKNPCMVRIAGAASRYRNDPYGCPVLPRIGNSAPAAPHPSRLAPLPPAFAMIQGRRRMLRVQEEVARAAEFQEPESAEMPLQASEETINDHSSTATTDSQLWAFVRLKHEVLLYAAPFPIHVGDRVVMEGDRGENIGTVELLQHEVPLHPVACRVLRFATDDDMQALDAQRTREEAAKHFAQGVADALNLNIRIVDTEFQADGNKLTVYFSSRRQIDFRRLQRQLFKQYRCRIWLVNWADVVKK